MWSFPAEIRFANYVAIPVDCDIIWHDEIVQLIVIYAFLFIYLFIILLFFGGGGGGGGWYSSIVMEKFIWIQGIWLVWILVLHIDLQFMKN